jgi:glycosyltransferase involved in cell wall biosynthesis
VKRIAVIGNYVPRQCGIATFTTDLCESLAGQFPELTCFAIPVNDTQPGYNYPARVRFELSEDDLTSYRQAADFLNINKVDLVCLQHEFGIYGGPEGSHILWLLRDLRPPVVTTLHTIPAKPSPAQRKVLMEIVARSDRVVVMSQKGLDFLREIYGVAADKIDLIPHGIPDVPFADPNFYKDHFGVEGRFVILSFGLLGRNKGIENIIKALPEVLARYPKIVFMVVGATHPNVLRTEGESYRLFLQRLAQDLGVEQNVIFYNRFVSLEELIELIGATDLYVTPYLNQDQIVSGTLAYALGSGKAVVSTPYWYAEELLADGAGILVPFAAPDALAHAILHLVESEAERHAIRKQAYLLGRGMIWPVVAQRYMQSFTRAYQDRSERPRVAFSAKTLAEGKAELPPLKLQHLHQMTDAVGLLQHAVATVPNYSEGYTVDDNARALVLTILLEELGKEWLGQTAAVASRYLALLWHAFNPELGRFRNFMSYDRRWLEEVGSEDSHGRALWGLGTVLGRSRQKGLRAAAARLFEMALPAVHEFTHLQSTAFALVALHEYLRQFPGDRAAQDARTALAERVYAAYRNTASDDWPWFEDALTYGNAKLPQVMLLSGRWMGQPRMVEAGLKALGWLASIQTSGDGHFVPIGNRGFYRRGAEPARFDQQPIEAQTMVSACIEAYHVTGHQWWKQQARRAFEWFLGRNDLGVALYDPLTGGCCDGLTPEGANVNEGAESTLAFLVSLTELRLLEHIIPVGEDQVPGDGQPVVPDQALLEERLGAKNR